MPEVGLLVQTITCRTCGHSWTHPVMLRATIHPVKPWRVRFEQALDKTNIPHYSDEDPLTFYQVEDNLTMPFCHRCIDTTKLYHGPRYWYPKKGTDKSNKPIPNIKASILGD